MGGTCSSDGSKHTGTKRARHARAAAPPPPPPQHPEALTSLSVVAMAAGGDQRPATTRAALRQAKNASKLKPPLPPAVCQQSPNHAISGVAKSFVDRIASPLENTRAAPAPVPTMDRLSAGGSNDSRLSSPLFPQPQTLPTSECTTTCHINNNNALSEMNPLAPPASSTVVSGKSLSTFPAALIVTDMTSSPMSKKDSTGGKITSCEVASPGTADRSRASSVPAVRNDSVFELFFPDGSTRGNSGMLPDGAAFPDGGRKRGDFVLAAATGVPTMSPSAQPLVAVVSIETCDLPEVLSDCLTLEQHLLCFNATMESQIIAYRPQIVLRSRRLHDKRMSRIIDGWLSHLGHDLDAAGLGVRPSQGLHAPVGAAAASLTAVLLQEHESLYTKLRHTNNDGCGVGPVITPPSSSTNQNLSDSDLFNKSRSSMGWSSPGAPPRASFCSNNVDSLQDMLTCDILSLVNEMPTRRSVFVSDDADRTSQFAAKSDNEHECD